MDERLQERLRAVARRYRSLRLWRSLAAVWLLAAAVGGVLLWQNARSASPLPLDVATFGFVALSLAALAAVLAILSFRSHDWTVHRLEQQFPDLDQRLITAIAQRPAALDGSYGYLQKTVLDEALLHADRRRWEQAVSEAQLTRARWLNLPGLLLLAVVLTGLWTKSGPAIPVPEGEFAEQAPRGAARVVVEPGDTEIERGSRLTVFARFSGTVPKEAALVVAGTEGVERIPMTRSLNDPLFGGQRFDIAEDLEYHVEFAGEQSETYRVTVFEYPRLVRSDARIVYPSYTDASEKLIEDTRRVSAVEGSELTWICHLNKPVKEALLVDEEGGEIPLGQSGDSPHAYAASIVLTESRRWTLKLVDEEGRPNQYPPQLIVTVVPNKPPEIKLALARDLRVSPLEEVPVQASFQDDFGLVQGGLTYSIAGETEDVVLTSADDGSTLVRHEASHLLDFEKLQAEPDQLLSYYFWAEDLGPDGEPRRTASDMFFAEVRHFEEIFREGQQPPGGQSQQQQQQQGQGQNAQQAEELAELQKQIITGTWNVIRRETQTTLSTSFGDDVTLLRDSQASALEQVDSLAEQVTDEESQGYIGEVRTRMQEAIGELSAAVDGPAKDSLPAALAAEQAAYQGLLSLRAREHEVVRGQQQQSSSSSSSSSSSARFQEQLQQLELQNDENRYETERQAQATEENDQQREMRQVLNRLRELAQRQQDLNEQLQQLQTALQQAETQQEREEIERQLKRLRDQQEEMLRDTDELAQRMSESQNQSEMQQPQEQVQETRENVRQSAEALGQQNVPQALSAGTRAEQQFEEMRDEFRRRTANQFSEEMQQMREDARELDEEQQALGEQLANADQESRGSLRADGNRQQLRERLQEQQENLQDLLERMQETVQNAESSEPLLADSLYEAIREARQQQLPERLEMTGELLRNGMDPQARQVEQTAREGVTNLRESVEQAAEEVLGDESEALQRALGELERLSRELNQEIDREDPSQAEAGGNRPEAESTGNGRPAEDQPARNADSSVEVGQSSRQPQRGGGEPQESSGNQAPQGRDPAGAGRPSNRAEEEQQSENARDGQGRQPDGDQPTEPQDGQELQNSQSPGQQRGEPSEDPSQSSPRNGQPGQSGRQSPRGGPSGGGASDAEQQTPSRSDAADQPAEDDANPFDPQQADRRGGPRGRGPYDASGIERFGGDNVGAAPITGDSFRDWSDRLRDVEEIVGDPELRSEAARIRERARDIRRDVRGGEAPQWDLVRHLVAEPLDELRERVAEELLRRSAEKNALVPIDRDPVPDQFTEQVRRYYERLGSGD